MNHLITAIYRFFFSHDFSIGVQKAIGIFIPVAILYLLHFDFPFLFIAGYGSLTIAIADQTGPLKHKRNEMFAALIATLLISFIFSSHQHFSIGMIVSLSLVTFFAGFVHSFGRKFISLGFVLGFSALMAARTPYDPFTYLIFFEFGALFYFFYALLFSKVFERYIIRQNLSNVYFLLSKHLKALSSCYRQNVVIEEQFKHLISSQADLLEELQLMRDLLFRIKNPEHEEINRMIHELLILIETRELMVVPLQEFITIRKNFPNTDIQIFFRDTFSKAGNNLEEMGMYTLRAGNMLKRLGFKAELRALEYELELLRREEPSGDLLEGYQVIAAHYRKAWSLSRQLERLRALLIGETTPKEAISPSALSKFLSHSYWSNDYFKQNLKLSSNVMRYAIRSASAMFVALLLVKSTNFLSHGFWIAFTLLSLMRPGFSLTKERSRNRIIGTVLGCVIGGLLISMEISIPGLIAIMFISVILNHGLLRVHNPLSVAFTSLYVLILLNIDKNLTAWQGISLAGERIIDTGIAAAMAIGFSYLLPTWEKQNIPQLIDTARENLFKVFLEIEKWKITEQTEQDLDVKLALRVAQTSIVSLSNSLERMQDEPAKRRTHNISELNDEVVEMQSILSQLSYLSFLLSELEGSTQEIEEFNEIFTLIKARMNPENQHRSHKRFTMRELKPLIWMIESKNSASS